MSDLTLRGRKFSDLVIEVFRANSSLLAQGDVMTQPVGLTSARWQVLGVVEHGPAPGGGFRVAVQLPLEPGA